MESILISRLGERKSGHRLWVEESATKPRLELNGFSPETYLIVTPRQGSGFIVKPSLIKTKYRISKRGSKSLLSLEGEWLKTLFPWNTAKIRVSVNSICIVPALSIFGFQKGGIAEINQDTIEGNSQAFTWEKRAPWRQKPTKLIGIVTDINLILVSYFVRIHLPTSLELKSESLLFPTLLPILHGLNYKTQYANGVIFGEL